MRHMVGGEHSLQISATQLLRFGIDSVLEDSERKDHLRGAQEVSAVEWPI